MKLIHWIISIAFSLAVIVGFLYLYYEIQKIKNPNWNWGMKSNSDSILNGSTMNPIQAVNPNTINGKPVNYVNGIGYINGIAVQWDTNGFPFQIINGVNTPVK